MKLIMLLTSLAASIFRAPDGAGTGGSSESAEGSGGVQDYARENAELAQRCQDAGIEVPAFPAGPAGLEKCRQWMREELKKREEGGEETAKNPDDLEGEELRQLARDEDADFDDDDDDAAVREAINDNREAKKQAREGTTGSTQTNDA